jgi:hypothetical protein
MGRLNDPTINDYIPDKEAPIDINQFLPKTENTIIENIHIETTRTDLTETEIKRIVEIATEALQENDGVNDGVSDGVNNDDLLDLEDKPIEKVVETDGVNEGAVGGAIEGAIGGAIEWSGKSYTVNKNEREVKLEDVQPEVPQIGKILIQSNEINKVQKPYSPPPEEKVVGIAEKLMHGSQNNIRNIREMEKIFDNPDLPDNHTNPIFEAINKLQKHQNIIKKE